MLDSIYGSNSTCYVLGQPLCTQRCDTLEENLWHITPSIELFPKPYLSWLNIHVVSLFQHVKGINSTLVIIIFWALTINLIIKHMFDHSYSVIRVN